MPGIGDKFRRRIEGPQAGSPYEPYTPGPLPYRRGDVVQTPPPQMLSEESAGQRIPQPGAPIPPTTGQAIAEGVAGTLGGAAGGIVGGLLGGPVGAVAMGVPAAAAFSGLAAAGLRGNEALPEAAIRGAVGEAIGVGIGHAGGPMLGSLARSSFVSKVPGLRTLARLSTGPSTALEPGAAAAQAALQQRGATLTAGQASTSSLIDVSENIARSSIFGRPVMQRALQRSQAAAVEDIEAFANTLLASSEPHVRGALIQSAIKGEKAAYMGVASAKYEHLDDTLRAAGLEDVRLVDVRGLKNLVNEEWNKYPAKVGIAKLGTLRKQLNQMPDHLTFKEAHNLRTLLGAQTPEPGTAANVIGGLNKKLYGMLDDIIENAPVPKSVRTAHRDAQAFYKAGVERFNNEFIEKVVTHESPELIYRYAVKDGQPSNILRLRAALRNSPDFDTHWRNIQGQWFNDVLARATRQLPNGGRQLDGTSLLREIDKLTPAGEQALFGGSGLTHLRQAARTLQLTQKEPGESGIGSVMIQLKQPGAFVELGGAAWAITNQVRDDDGSIVPAASIILTPVALATVFRDKRFVNYLTQGLVAPVGSKTAGRIFGQLMARADQLGVLDRPRFEGVETPKTVKDRRVERARTAQTAGDILRQRIADKRRQMNPLGGGW